MWIGHRKEIRELTFRALAQVRRSESVRSDEGLSLERQLSLRCPIHIINPVDKIKLFYNTPTDAAPQFL